MIVHRSSGITTGFQRRFSAAVYITRDRIKTMRSGDVGGSAAANGNNAIIANAKHEEEQKIIHEEQ